MTIEQLQRFLELHDKHVAAYSLQVDVPPKTRVKYLAEMAKRRSEIELELKGRLS